MEQFREEGEGIKLLKYILFTAGFLILLIVVGRFQEILENIGKETFRLYPWSILSVLVNFPIGIYLGIPGFLKEYQKSGKWKINIYKIIFISLPMIYFSFFWFIPVSYPIPDFMVSTHLTFKFAMIASGLIFMNSITKGNSG